MIKKIIKNVVRNLKANAGYAVPMIAGLFLIFAAAFAKNPGEAPSVWFWLGILVFTLAFTKVKIFATAILRFLLRMPLGITQAIIEEASDSIHSYCKSLKRFDAERIDVVEDADAPLFSVKLRIKPSSPIKGKGKVFRATLERNNARGEAVFCVSNLHCTIGHLTYNEVKDNFYFI